MFTLTRRFARHTLTIALLATGVCGVTAGVAGHGMLACTFALVTWTMVAVMILRDVLADRP